MSRIFHNFDNNKCSYNENSYDTILNSNSISNNNQTNFNNNLNVQCDEIIEHTRQTFLALVEVIIPQTPRLAQEYGRIQYYGAKDLNIDEYLIMSFNNYPIPLTNSIAQLLDAAASQLFTINGSLGLGIFIALSPRDRMRVLISIEELAIDLDRLPEPFKNDSELVLSVIEAIKRLTLMGYYSEWSGYGSTRLDPPDRRVLEFFPISWQQVGYPGPSLGYRALREL